MDRTASIDRSDRRDPSIARISRARLNSRAKHPYSIPTTGRIRADGSGRTTDSAQVSAPTRTTGTVGGDHPDLRGHQPGPAGGRLQAPAWIGSTPPTAVARRRLLPVGRPWSAVVGWAHDRTWQELELCRRSGRGTGRALGGTPGVRPVLEANNPRQPDGRLATCRPGRRPGSAALGRGGRRVEGSEATGRFPTSVRNPTPAREARRRGTRCPRIGSVQGAGSGSAVVTDRGAASPRRP